MGNDAPAEPRDQAAADRIGELDALVTFLQADNERRSSSVARKLHDDLGGCVIGAMMDVAWIEQHGSKLPTDTAMRLARVNDGLRGAIDLTRKIVEELRPTLLDSMGLFAALSWQFSHGCKHAGIEYTESFPESPPEMDAHRLISVFRIAQELFNVALERIGLKSLALAVTVKEDAIGLQMTMDGKPSAARGPDASSIPMLSIMHRVKQLRGEAAITLPTAGIWVFRVSVPAVSI